MPRSDGGNTGENGALPTQYVTQQLQRSPLDILTLRKGDQWLNYSNQQGNNFLDRGALMDMITNGSIDPLGTYSSAAEAYKAYNALNPYQERTDRSPISQVAGGLRQGMKVTNYQAPVNWGSQWNPIFWPSEATGTPTNTPPSPTQIGNLSPGEHNGYNPVPTADTLAAQVVNDAANQGPSVNRDRGRNYSTAGRNALAFDALSWANSGWQDNMIMGGDRYGEFGTKRGL